MVSAEDELYMYKLLTVTTPWTKAPGFSVHVVGQRRAIIMTPE